MKLFDFTCENGSTVFLNGLNAVVKISKSCGVVKMSKMTEMEFAKELLIFTIKMSVTRLGM